MAAGGGGGGGGLRTGGERGGTAAAGDQGEPKVDELEALVGGGRAARHGASATAAAAAAATVSTRPEFSKEEVFRLQVSMYHSTAVAVKGGTQYLRHQQRCLRLRQAALNRLEAAAELAAPAELRDEPEVAACLEVLHEAADVGVVHERLGLDLPSQHAEVWDVLLVDALDRSLDARPVVDAPEDNPEGALTDGVCRSQRVSLLDAAPRVLPHQPRGQVRRGQGPSRAGTRGRAAGRRSGGGGLQARLLGL
mmetsp:Transcript_54820/g.155306  ORF Transcript_54820/g.155306 Transcript_54820/m.155306 type:complete len:251 (+) Transcript_54820:492-1244(+)